MIVNPTFVLGPDDPTGTSMGLVRRFLLRQIPAYVDGGLNIVDVRDVAAGHLLADEKGEVGERYILGGRNFTLDRLFADLSRISGVEPPAVEAARPGSPWRGAEAASRARAAAAGRRRTRSRSAALWWTYRNTKAQRELGFDAAPARGDARGRGRAGSSSALGDARRGAGRGDVPLRAARAMRRAAEWLVGR